MNSPKIVTVATDFSRYPAGRFISDGRYSGERFREEYLRPALEKGEKVIVYLDGVMGYGSSFLEEAFGGLIRANLDRKLLIENLTIQSANRLLVKEVLSYISSDD